MPTFCSIICCNMEKDTIVGTSTSCSASCVSRTAVRTGTSSSKILGTSTTCSGSGMIVSKKCRMFGNCPTICGTGAPRVCTMGPKRAKSTMYSTACRWTPSCGRGSARTLGLTPAVSSSKNSKNTASELCSQPPRPCPSCVPSGRRTFHQPPPCRSCGVRLRTGPLRRSLMSPP